MTENNINEFIDIKNFENDISNILTQSTFSKKKSLDRLNQNLESIRQDNDKLLALNNCIFSNDYKIYNILVNLLNDSLEKSKTISLNYLLEVKIPDELINNLIFQLDTNIKNEDVEEINFLITKLLNSIVNNSNENIVSMNCDKLCKIIKQTLNHSSPDQKEITAKLIQVLADKVPNRIIYFSSELIVPLISNMSNRQQRVRLESLNALTSLALSGSVKIIDTLEQHLLVLANDNSPTVRAALCVSIEKWSTRIPTSIQYYEFLLPILIGLSVSDIIVVRNSAIDSLNSISAFYQAERSFGNIDENTIKCFGSLDKQIQENKESVYPNIRYYITNSAGNGENSESKQITVESKKLIFQFSQAIMKRYYRDFHNQELDQNIRDFKINFLLAFIAYLGGPPTTRFIEAIIEIITVRFSDHFDQITKKVNEIIYILGLINIDEKTFVNRIIDRIKTQITAQESDTIDIQLLQICILVLKKFYSSHLINGQINNILNISTLPSPSPFTLLIDQMKQIIFKNISLNPFIKEFISFFNQIFTVNSNIIINIDDGSLNSLCKFLILLDLNGNCDNTTLFNLISSKCGFSDYLQLLEKNCGHLIKEISSKDKNQLQKQKSHLLILNYLLAKLPSNISDQYVDQINLIKK
ncbi:hypothetical protein DICPUDRAFT_158734 [Dictyostelium purpureum]|uniref:Dynein axonemal assembly factor 5 TPR repeats domain-containing protein n=1 Tax=Dictyostelium purpureum TaxID=5786 RepID=F1A2B9_DICPU|nr:uncharacterized protein DICPUDRAFT_158734 [Dictyostelium purpureum]EGC29661.1 hypothetical protein DICPUDRAFT_158734 [Dictyostelium purpureum]|eukprot:XP_003293814.1 hypothetical protein DICPUDRAFT_158734 [Dictyostelium purpureum]